MRSFLFMTSNSVYRIALINLRSGIMTAFHLIIPTKNTSPLSTSHSPGLNKLPSNKIEQKQSAPQTFRLKFTPSLLYTNIINQLLFYK